MSIEARRPRRNDTAVLALPALGGRFFRINGVEFNSEGQPTAYWLVDDTGGRVIPEFEPTAPTVRCGVRVAAQAVIAVHANILDPE